MGRKPCCSKDDKLNRGSWTAMEDKILTDYITLHGEGQWRDLPKKAGLKRCGKSCRLRWMNYLRPNIKRGNISKDEKDLIIRLHNLLGNRWSLIAGRLPGRTDNEIKNYWNTNIGKKNAQTPIRRTSSTPKYKSLNQHKEIKRNVDSSPTNAQPLVIRTKARRCTKVIIHGAPNYQPPCNDRLNTNEPLGPMVEPVSKLQKMVENADDHTATMMDQSQPSDFTKDLEMDDCFLSHLLDADISLFCGFDDDQDRVQGHIFKDIGTNDPTHVPEIDGKNMHDQDLQAMASFLDSELNWILS